jgi:UDP-N-acetylmuramoyl-tripeptide--D-alanyl-D-alanine ligase
MTTADAPPSPDQGLMLTAGIVAAAMDGYLAAGPTGAPIGGFSIDSRTVRPGDLFFAIKGDRLDGHGFVGEALRRGACGAVISDSHLLDSPDVAGAAVLIILKDTTWALQALARYVRRASGANVVAVTGSAGKSTTKEIAAAFLSTRYGVFRNEGNLNNHIGLPLSLLELRHQPEIAVVEFGMNHAGEIGTLVGIAEPEVRVWTNVGPAHLGFFGTMDAIADAKAELLEKALPENVLIANADDDRVMARAPRFAGRVATFGIHHRADVHAGSVQQLGIDGLVIEVETPIGELELRTPLSGEGNAANLLAGVAVAITFGVPLEDIAACAPGLKPMAHRGEVTRLADGTAILDDSYNSNPAALSGALGLLRSETRYARRVAVLGEMLELGANSEALHRTSGDEAAASGLGLLVAVGGPGAEALAREAVHAGMSGDAVHYVPASEEAAALAASLVRPGDLVLVKGSRGIRTDLVVERLKAGRG